MAEYAAAAQIDPKDPYWPIRTAICLLERGDVVAGRRALEEVVERSPAYAPAWHRLAGVLLVNGDTAGARAAVDRCLAILPTAYRAQATLADILLRSGDAAGAIPLLEEVTRADSSHKQAMYLLGRAYQQTGRTDEMVDLLLGEGAGALPLWVEDGREIALLELKSGLAEEMSRAITLLSTGRAREAVPRLERDHRYHPKDASVLINLAQARRDVGDLPRALAELDTAASLEPSNFRVHYVRALLLLDAGDAAIQGRGVGGTAGTGQPNPDLARRHFLEARDAAERAARLTAEEWRVHLAVARASSRLEDNIGARQALLAARKVVPANTEVNQWLFEVCWQIGDTEMALSALEALVAADPRSLIGWVNLIHVRAERKDFDGARAALDKAREIDPMHARVVDAATKLEERIAAQPPPGTGTSVGYTPATEATTTSPAGGSSETATPKPSAARPRPARSRATA
jgi:tetratricopeptide (TPR) repeat protein